MTDDLGALALYAQAPRGARVHVRGRWHSAPLPAIDQHLPRSGRILEVGCGLGLFATYAALAGPQRQIVGIDHDAAKIAIAQRAATPLADRLGFEVGDDRGLPAGPWDAIVIVDVLYLLPEAEQRTLIARCLTALRGEGVLVVKEMSGRPRPKYWWNVAQETISVRLLRMTKGRTVQVVPIERIAQWCREHGATVTTQRLDRRSVHPHALLVARPLTRI